MRELTLKQKNDFIWYVINYPSKNRFNYYICNIFDVWMMEELDIVVVHQVEMATRFPELWTAIKSAIKKTVGLGYAAIHYKDHIGGRIKLLKRVKKQL